MWTIRQCYFVTQSLLEYDDTDFNECTTEKNLQLEGLLTDFKGIIFTKLMQCRQNQMKTPNE